MGTQDDDEVWVSVKELWPGLEALRAGGFRSTPALIAETLSTGRSSQSAAVRLVAAAVSDHVAQSFPPERKQQLVGELQQVLRMSFEETKITPVDPFVHKVVTAWQVISGWADEGRTEQESPGFFLKHIVGALVH